MRQFFTSLLLLCLPLVLTAQHEADIFYFGTAGLDFSTNPPTVLTNSAMDGRESPTVACDSAGNLLFYTNGGNHPLQQYNGAVWNKNHEVMENGLLYDTAGCSSSFQGSIAVPFPGNKNQYYLFTKDCMENRISYEVHFDRGLRYTVIDLSFNNGLGKVIEKGVPVIPFPTEPALQSTGFEPLTAVQHANNRDFWVFSYNNSAICRFLVDSNGIQPYEIVGHVSNYGGRIVVSPTRDYIAFGDELYRLNAASGGITFIRKVPIEYGCLEFSPNGRLLYTLGKWDYMHWALPLAQYDLSASDFEASRIFISYTSSHQLSLAPNGTIYVWGGSNAFLQQIIYCANERGLDCSFHADTTDLQGKESGLSLPNLLTHYLYRDSLPCTHEPTKATLENSDNSMSCDITIWPNPTNGLVNLAVAEEHSVGDIPRLYLSDLNGKIIENYGTVPKTGYTFDTKGLSAGLYIITVDYDEDDRHFCRFKLVVGD